MVLHEVLTTEKVPFTYRVAGIGARFLAWLFDAGFIIIIGLIGACAGGVYTMADPGVGGALARLWMFGLMFGYFLFFEWLWHGQTPGKRLLGIRVIQTDGASITFFQSVGRNVIRLIDSLPIFYGIGFTTMASNTKSRRLGDLAAGTLVVQVERKARPIRAVQEGAREGGAGNEGQIRSRLGVFSREQKQTIIDLCLRRDQLRTSDRARLFHAVAEHLVEEIGLTRGQHQSDEKFVLQVAAVLGTGMKG